MELHNYKQEAMRTDYADYSDYHTGDATARLDYGVTGLVTESAKLLDLVKKSKKNLATLDRVRVKEELGDLFWYINITLDELDFSYEDIMKANLAKISEKYPKGDLNVSTLTRGYD